MGGQGSGWFGNHTGHMRAGEEGRKARRGTRSGNGDVDMTFRRNKQSSEHQQKDSSRDYLAHSGYEEGRAGEYDYHERRSGRGSGWFGEPEARTRKHHNGERESRGSKGSIYNENYD
jgi:hypothetical protein